MVESSQNNVYKIISTCLLLFIITFTLYIGNANNKYASGDVVPTSVLPFSMAYHLDFKVGRYLFTPNQPVPYYLKKSNDDYVSTSPIGSAITAFPLYLPYMLFGGKASIDQGAILGKFSASILAALSVSLVYYMLRKQLQLRNTLAVVYSLLYGIGSQTFSISSQGLWQHGSVELWTIVVFILLLNILNSKSKQVEKFSSYALGIAIGMLLLTRPIAFVIISPLFICILNKRNIINLLRIAITFLPLFLVNISYNVHYFGSFSSSGYGDSARVSGFFSFPLLLGLLGNLFSPSKGLLIFMPWALFSFFWIVKLREKSFFSSIYFGGLISVFIHFIFYSKFFQWPAGYCYGPRYMTDITPTLILLSSSYINNLFKNSMDYRKKLIVVLLIVVLIWSSIIQLLGTYEQKGESWNIAAYPDNFMEPLWSIKGSQVAYHFNTLRAQFKEPIVVSNPKVEFSDIKILDKPFLYEKGNEVTLLAPNKIYFGEAVIKNLGDTEWSAFEGRKGSKAVHFSYSLWDGAKNIEKEGIRSGLLNTVKPNESIKVYFKLKAPSNPGNYQYYFTLVQEGVSWFSKGGPGSNNSEVINVMVGK